MQSDNLYISMTAVSQCESLLIEFVCKDSCFFPPQDGGLALHAAQVRLPLGYYICLWASRYQWIAYTLWRIWAKVAKLLGFWRKENF